MKGLVLLVIIFFSFQLKGQESRLANEYFQTGEYEKAATIYKKLFDQQSTSFYYFGRYIESLMAVEDFALAEKEIIAQIKKDPKQMQLYVTLGNLKERQFLPDEADASFRKAIENIPPDVSVINNLGSSFMRLAKYDMAVEAYLRGSELLNNESIFANNLAELYKRKGDTPKMIKYYILAAERSPKYLERYKTYLQKSLKNDDDLEELRRQLYEKIQEDPENVVYPELLEWVYIEKEAFDLALRQARSMDRKLDEGGARVMRIADIAYTAGDYDTAIKAYEYLTKDKSLNNNNYVDGKRALLQAKRKKVTSTYDYASADLDSLQLEYERFIEEFGMNARTDALVKEYADFMAIYQNDLDTAIKVLNELIELQSINRYIKANSKVSLADYYLMQDEIWEATLLYAQVDKEFEEEYMGEVARFKNAMLYYYAGNFAWAQEQFDILKSATSKLISNDAIDMSVFILDNMGLDTTDVPLKMFAQAELLTTQNRFDDAFSKLDSISILFPEHSLEDDILYQKANLNYQLKAFDKALELYAKVYTDFPEEIRADNALFRAAKIYDNELQQPEEAQALYEKLFIDFSNSSFAVEARKRFRILRGDDIQ